MGTVEWREVAYYNAHEYIGKIVRVRADLLEGYVYSTLRVADITGFTVDAPARRDGLSYDWDEASMESPWYCASGNITLTEPAELLKTSVEGWIKGAEDAK